MLGPLERTASAQLSLGEFEIFRGEWLKPGEYPYKSDRPVISAIFVSPSYRMEGRILGAGREEFMPLGKTLMLPADHEFIGRGSGGPISVARCTINRDAWQRLVKPDFGLTEAEVDRSLNMDTATINILIRRMAEEIASPGFGGDVLLESLATALVVECGRHIFCDRLPAAPVHEGLRARDLQAVDDYLERIETGTPRISDVAAAAGLSSHYFAKRFRQATGQSIGRYITQWRLRRAQRLLLETDLPLKEIAYRLGFANAANFSTAFRNELAMPPGTFRRIYESGRRGSGQRLN